MTVPAQDRFTFSSGNGVTTTFPYTFMIPGTVDDPQFLVYLIEIATGTRTDLTVDVDYSISGLGVEEGGVVTYPLSGAPLPTTHRIVIESNMPYEQQTDVYNSGTLYLSAIEDQFDNTTRQVQQIQDRVNRTFSVGIGYEGNYELFPVANKLIGWNSTGTALENKQSESESAAGAYAAQLAAEAAAASINQRIYTTMAEAKGDTIPAAVKRIQIQFRTSDRIPFSGFHARRVDPAGLSGYPAESHFQSNDRFMPDGTPDATNGGNWVLDEAEPYPEMLGAKGDGITPDQAVLAALAKFLDVRSGGGTIRSPNSVYLCEAEWELPCGVNLIGPVTLKYTNTGGNGIYCSTNPARLGQHSIIRNVTFGRSGSNGGKAIYTEQDNAPFYTQAPAWIIEGNFFRDLDADYTYPPDPSGIASFAWEWCVDMAHSNGSAIRDNDMIGNFNPTIAEAGQFACGGIHLGTEPSNTNGVIAVDISSNRIWYQRNAFDIGEDVLAFWFQKNEVIKCYRGIYAAADPGGDGTASQADTRIIDNFITTCTSGINLINRQMLHIIGNHTNSDATYYDNGGGFNGIRLESCTKYKIRGNSANLSAGHAAWTGTHRAVLLVASDNGSVTDQSVSRYFDEGIYLNGSNNVRIDGIDLTQVTDAGFAFVGTCRKIAIGIVNYMTAEPANRYFFYDANTDIHDLTITADEWVVPSQSTALTVATNAVTVTRRAHLIDTGTAPQTVNTITGPSVRSGVRLTLRASGSTNALTLADAVGNLLLEGDFISTNARDFIELEFSEALNAWLEISRSNNA